MSIFLWGGGAVDPSPFVAEAAARAEAAGRDVPRIAVIVADTGDGDFFSSQIVASLEESGPVSAAVLSYGPEDEAELADLVDVDAVYVAGGATPEYLRIVQPLAGEIRRLVADGMPYLGVSAGALIAAEKALVAGYRIGDVAVAPEMIGDGEDELRVDRGIGLIDLTVEVHAAQWGTLGRLVAATEAGVVPGGVAVDENTALVVSTDGLGVLGTGSLWQVLPGDNGVTISTAAAR